MILACDQCDDTIRLMWGDKAREQSEEIDDHRSAARRVQELGEYADLIIFSDTVKLEGSIKLKKRREVLSRFETAYQSLQASTKTNDCLILSIGKSKSIGGRIEGGRFVPSFEKEELGLKALYDEWWQAVDHYREAIDHECPETFRSDPIGWGFRDFLDGLRCKKSLSLPTLESLEGASAPQWKKLLFESLAKIDRNTSPQSEKKCLFCTDWAGTEPVKALFTDYNLIFSPDPFMDAVRGLFQGNIQVSVDIPKEEHSIKQAEKRTSPGSMINPRRDALSFAKQLLESTDVRNLKKLISSRRINKSSRNDFHTKNYFYVLIAHKYQSFGEEKEVRVNLGKILTCQCDGHCSEIKSFKDLMLANLDSSQKRHIVTAFNNSESKLHNDRDLKTAYYTLISRLRLWESHA